MPIFQPFRGYRYDTQAVGDLAQVVTQPYDKIGPELQQEYLQRSPFNLAWIIRSPEKNADPSTTYPETGRRFRQWLNDGVLRQDAAPSFYPYTQDFSVNGVQHHRTAIIGLLDLREGRRRVQAHERTMSGPKEDRLRLLRATEANDGLIFMLYRDPDDRAGHLLEGFLKSQAPVAAVAADLGVQNRLWRLSDGGLTAAIAAALSDAELFIADGHHRFETAVTFLDESTSRGWRPAALESFDQRMVALVNAADPGLIILPTHRLVGNIEGFDPVRFLERVAPFFAIEQCTDVQHLLRRMAASPGVAIGFFAAAHPGFFCLELVDSGALKGHLPEASDALRTLDVTVLHTLLLRDLLGIDEAKLVAETHVTYVRSIEDAIGRTTAGACQAAFLLNPTTVDQVLSVASGGELMPQKSTDFFPKLLSGLVFSVMEIDRGQ